MQVKTKSKSTPEDESRIFFTCHPSDWDKCFDRICEDVFKTHDAAIYYIDSQNDKDTDSALLETDLRQMSLFIIPVSLKLLTEPSFARDKALPFAKTEHIPILPIMLEKDLYELYKKKELFGTLEYLRPNTTDLTAISYEKKLKDYLDSVLIGSELADRVRNAFDAYVFLSYRKKDRAHANELMRMIHKDPLCRDIAIWYDEFLTPGEDFDNEIENAMKKSKLFTLLVTPNLVIEKNYVQSEEYPRARKAGLKVMPVEMIETDKTKLEEKFPQIPTCIDKKNVSEISDRVHDIIKPMANEENDDDPEHNYLIGVAYYDGIDMEVNREKAAELFLKAANANHLEAMVRVSNMYKNGDCFKRDVKKYIAWLERIFNLYYSGMYGERFSERYDVYEVYKRLTRAYEMVGKKRKALGLYDLYQICINIVIGSDSIFLSEVNWDRKKKIKELKEEYRQVRRYGDDCICLDSATNDPIELIEQIARLYISVNRRKAARYYKKLYRLYVKDYGLESQLAADAFRNWAMLKYGCRNPRKTIKIIEKLINSDMILLDTAIFEYLSYLYDLTGNETRSLEVLEDAYRMILDEDNHIYVSNEYNAKTVELLADRYSSIGFHEKSYRCFMYIHDEIVDCESENAYTLKILCKAALECKFFDKNGLLDSVEELIQSARETIDLSKYSDMMDWSNMDIETFIRVWKDSNISSEDLLIDEANSKDF